MRTAKNVRGLLPQEIAEADKVFDDSLPAYRKILITDALGSVPGNDDPFTEELMGGINYTVNVGPTLYPDLTRGIRYGGYGIDRNILIHELTHVWQYYHGYHVILGAAWARVSEIAGLVRDSYAYTPGLSWRSYNVEQQAHLVEDWYNPEIGRRSAADLRYPYIDKIVRPGLDQPSLFNKRMLELMITSLSGAELRAL